MPAGDLIDVLALGAREHVAIVGGGGKTTLMIALADALKRGGRRVVATTTTRILHRDALRFSIVMIADAGSGWRSRVRDALRAEGSVFVAEEAGGNGKLKGVMPSVADALFEDAFIDDVIVEADGSAGRPVKVPAVHEPVIPASATLVVAVMGLEAVGRPSAPDTVFRMNEFQRISGIKAGETLTPEVLATAFRGDGGLFKGAPGPSRRIAFLNKLDLATDRRGAEALWRILSVSKSSRANRVIAGSLRLGEYPLVSSTA
jgi:probable selenium-dependent hydroxylase accessory protein YqeC